MSIVSRQNGDGVCPLCGSRELQGTDMADVDFLCRAWHDAFRIDVSELFVGSGAMMRMLTCATCGAAHFTPSPLGPDWLYEKLQGFDWYYRQRKWEHLRAMRWISHSMNVLEVGCGGGAFLELLRERHIAGSGIDLNPKAVAEARAKGLDASVRPLDETVAQYRGSLDVVCAFQILEHVPAPREFLGSLFELLAPGGLLLVGVPCADSFGKHRLNTLDAPPHHQTRWRDKSFLWAAAHFRAELCRLEREPLADCHIDSYLDIQTVRVLAACPWLRTGIGMCRNRAEQVIRRLSLNRWIKGEGLFVAMRKTGDTRCA